jgi:predicted RNA binding protein with dsRBD fold (UPF0201 family)
MALRTFTESTDKQETTQSFRETYRTALATLHRDLDSTDIPDTKKNAVRKLLDDANFHKQAIATTKLTLPANPAPNSELAEIKNLH